MEYYKNIEGTLFEKVKIYYTLGGYNFFSGKQERRGIYFSLTEVHKTKGTETFSVGDNLDKNYGKVFLLPLKRFSQKKLDEVIERFNQDPDLHIKLFKEGNINILVNRLTM